MDEQVRRLRRSSESGRPLGGVVIFKLSALACAAALAAGVAPAAASDVDFHWDGRQFVTADRGFSLRPKGRLLLDASTTDGSAFAARNIVGDEMRALRFGVEGMVGEHLFYTAEGDFAGDKAILRGTYLAWRDRWAGKDVELVLGNRLSERGLDGSSSSDGTPFLERNAVALAVIPLKGFYGWGGIAKVYGADWHVTAQVAGDDPGNLGVAKDVTTYLARTHWNPVKSAAGVVHLGAWGFYEDFPPGMDSHSRNTAWAGHLNKEVQVPLGALADPVYGAGYGVELGAARGPVWGFVEAGRRVIDTRTDHVTADATAWTAGWMITGENSAYSSRGGTFVKIAPRAPVSKGGPGAWEVAVRYQSVDNTDAPLGGKGQEAEVGVNWRLEDWLRLMVNLSHWEVTHRAGKYAGVDDGDSLAGRLQIAF